MIVVLLAFWRNPFLSPSHPWCLEINHTCLPKLALRCKFCVCYIPFFNYKLIISSHSWKQIFFLHFFSINLFVPNVPFLYTLKTSGNLRVSDVFRGCRKGALGTNRLRILTKRLFMLPMFLLRFVNIMFK